MIMLKVNDYTHSSKRVISFCMGQQKGKKKSPPLLLRVGFLIYEMHQRITKDQKSAE